GRGAAVAPTGYAFRAAAGPGDEDRSRSALLDVGGSAARPPHRARLSAGRHHRDRLTPWAGCAAVAPDRRADPESRGQCQGFARADAGTGPWLMALWMP